MSKPGERPLFGREARAGAFIVLGLFASLALFGSIAGIGAGGGAQKRFVIRLGSASGVQVDTPVHFAGVRVGRVESVAIDPLPGKDGSIRLALLVGIETPVRVDSTATVKGPLVGDAYVDLTPGTSGAELARDGDMLAAVDPPSLEAMAKELSRVGARVESLADEVGPALREGEAALREVRLLAADLRALAGGDVPVIIEDLKGLAKAARSRADELAGLIEGARGAVDEAQALARTARETLDEARPRVSSSFASLESLLARLERLAKEEDGRARGILAQVEAAVVDARRLLASSRDIVTGNAREVHRTLAGLERTSAHLESLAARLERRPSLLIFDDDEVEAELTVERLRRLRRDDELLERGRLGPVDAEPPR